MRCWTATPPPRRGDAVDVAVADSLGVVEEPVQAVEGDIRFTFSKTSSERPMVSL
jgi:hypothetical protein